MSEPISATTGRAGPDHGFQEDVRRLGRYVGQLHEDLGGIAKGAGEAAQSGLAAAKEGGRGALEAAKGKGRQGAASLRGRMAEHPGTTLGIAVGAGVILGLFGTAMVRSMKRRS